MKPTMVHTRPAAASVAPPLSQSLQAKLACPFLYVESYVRRRHEPPNPYAERGQQIHLAIETYLRHLVATNQPSDFTFFAQLLDTGYLPEAVELLEGMRDTLIMDPQRVLAVEPYLALDEEMNPVDVDPAAPPHMLQDNPPAGVAFAGIPDLLVCPDAVTVDCFDWKSQFQIFDPETFQAQYYPMLIFMNYPGVQKINFHLYFVRYNAIRSVEYTREADLDRLVRRAKRERARQLQLHFASDLIEGKMPDDPMREIGEEMTKAMPGGHCVYCPRLGSSQALVSIGDAPAADNPACPIAGINPYTTQTPEDRLRFAVWASQAAKANAEVLREFVKAGGAVEFIGTDNVRWAAEYMPTEKRILPALPTIALLQKWDAEHPDDQLCPKARIGRTELGSPLKAKKRAALAAEIGTVEITEQTTKWHIGKRDDEDEEER